MIARRLPALDPAGLFGRSRRARWRRLLLRRLLAVVLLAAAALTLAATLPGTGGPDGTAVVSTRDLPAGHRLEPADVRVVAFPAALTGAGLAPDDLIGQVVAGPVGAAEVLTRTRVVPRTATQGLPGDLTPLHVVVTDPVMLDLLVPGGRARIHRPGEAQALARGVPVLLIDPSPPPAPGGAAGAGRGVVLALPDDVVAQALATSPEEGPPRLHVLPEAPAATAGR